MRLTPLASALVVLCSLGALAQQPPSTAQQPATAPPPASGQPPITFRVEIDYVELDAIVTDAQGRPVRNLTREDFQVFEEGQPQTVTNFSQVDLPLERPDAPLFAASEIEPDVRSNRREFDGRVYVLVLDDLHTHVARSVQVREAAREFISRYFGANDVAAIVQTGGGSRKGVQEFTSSRARLLRALDAFMGQKLRSSTLEKLDDYNLRRGTPDFDAPRDLSEAERASKARRTLSSLKSVADYLAGIRGRRKAVIFFSEGIDYDMTNPVQNRYASDILDETQEAIAAATRANVSFYAVDPRGLGGLSQEAIEIAALPDDPSIISPTALHQELLQSQDSLRTISNETGGFAAVNRNDFSTTFARIVSENSTYYVLGYTSTDTRRDGRFRKIDIRVSRPGLEVRARKGYVAPKGRPASRTSVNEDTSAQLSAAMQSPVPISALGISVFAAPLKGSGNKASLLLAVEVDGAKLRFTQKDGVFADDVEVAVLAVDDRGEIRDGGRDLLNLRLRPETHALVSRSGTRILRRLEVPPGRYQLRVGVRDGGSGAVGSVLSDLDVPDFSKAALSMSGLLLTSASANRIPTANPDPDFSKVMPGPPVTLREFPQNDVLAVFAEVYDNLTKTPHRVSIKTTVLSDTGTVVFAAEGERRNDELKGASGGYGHTTTIPLKGFAPGRYVLRVEARTLLSDGSTASRDIEFRIR
ncbi:MAG TPA: VWA domain-containing protein [Vicinamibacterales bacterium]|nr:VWA domain-containing protein [Vicinamibacterales bacterium]